MILIVMMLLLRLELSILMMMVMEIVNLKSLHHLNQDCQVELIMLNHLLCNLNLMEHQPCHHQLINNHHSNLQVEDMELLLNSSKMHLILLQCNHLVLFLIQICSLDIKMQWDSLK